ncbi:hypothetical protein M5G20_21875 [Pseudomonas sp. TNT2022 ID1044]|uniref:hypothetical protein n=1 Tax=Pseudomonas sp. TNT2022 ID1044 TaxID=2942636 RepID=UPI00235E9706|nr:hypothetical protein [Pseudomonas sp. TNT2022 ID1044]MDD0998497.1 hypothetical protein [Pseudomonas sp. TNT2022 ID1044]
MSIEQQAAITLKRDDAMQVFELLIALDHHRVDLKHAMERAWDSQDYTQVRAHLFSAQDTLSDACQLFLQKEPADSLDQ